jgi:hypothetical protein
MFSFKASLLVCITVVALTPAVFADTIVVAFSDPVLSGMVESYPKAGQETFIDNTRTAAYGVHNGKAGSFLLWGTSRLSEPYQTFSELLVVGGTIPADTSGPFELATLTYTNGDSANETAIFGATISFYDNVISPSTFLGSDQLIITNTANVFGRPGGLGHGDDDYIAICGHQSNLCATPVEAVESSEGGSSVTVQLFGTLAVGSSSQAATPEPGSFSLILTGGLAGSWLWKRRRSARNA